jgi:hypothetical protein
VNKTIVGSDRKLACVCQRIDRHLPETPLPRRQMSAWLNADGLAATSIIDMNRYAAIAIADGKGRIGEAGTRDRGTNAVG